MNINDALKHCRSKEEGCTHPSLPPRFKYHVLVRADLTTGWQEWRCVMNTRLHVGYVDCVLPEEGWEIVNIRERGQFFKEQLKRGNNHALQ